MKRKSHEYEQNHKNDQEQKSQTQIGTTSENWNRKYNNQTTTKMETKNHDPE